LYLHQVLRRRAGGLHCLLLLLLLLLVLLLLLLLRLMLVVASMLLLRGWGQLLVFSTGRPCVCGSTQLGQGVCKKA
jgi:hypothetical protein